jgi:hypothetical protein
MDEIVNLNLIAYSLLLHNQTENIFHAEEVEKRNGLISKNLEELQTKILIIFELENLIVHLSDQLAKAKFEVVDCGIKEHKGEETMSNPLTDFFLQSKVQPLNLISKRKNQADLELAVSLKDQSTVLSLLSSYLVHQCEQRKQEILELKSELETKDQSYEMIIANLQKEISDLHATVTQTKEDSKSRNRKIIVKLKELSVFIKTETKQL